MNEETLFHAALGKPATDRAAFLDEACAGQPQLRVAVEALLASHEAAGSFLDKPAVELGRTDDSEPGPDQPAVTGRHTPELYEAPTVPPRSQGGGGDEPVAASGTPGIGPGIVLAGKYRLEQLLGEGGMGEVWIAQQSVPVKRQVALKLIKTGMDSKAVLARFEQERQALAVMDHPNIAKVLDGGMTATGQPFFVMELVNGRPLNKFCDEAKLTPKERLKLFVPICQAVQHAHQKGIVHRDLKPANILVALVDGKPVPKVIDFGVAKATGGKLTDESMATQMGAVIGTLEYMAPEQAGGEDIDTRADIYSLGVILYELLTGLRPIDAAQFRKAAMIDMIMLLLEHEPSKPSTRLSTADALPSLAALRQIEPKKLMAMLRGELDWVVMKCLEKQRDRRYESANGLARDIQRYLADEPVEARPPSAGYRFQKFVRRHRGQVIAASLVLFALLAGMIGTSWGLVEANHARLAERDRAEGERLAKLDAQANEKLAGDRLVQVEAEKKKADEEKLIAQSVRDFLQKKLLAQADTRIQANALLQAGESSAATNLNPTIRELLDRAAKELAPDNIEASFPNQPLIQAEILLTIGNAYIGIGEYQSAIDFLNRSEALRRRHLGSDHPSALVSMNSLAWAYHMTGKDDQASSLYEELLQISKAKLGADDPRTLGAMNNLGAIYTKDNPKRAVPILEEALKLSKSSLGPEDSRTLQCMIDLGKAYQNAEKLDLALPLFKEAFEIEKATLGPNHPDTIYAMSHLADANRLAGKFDMATSLSEEALKLSRTHFGPDHPSTIFEMQHLAAAYRQAGKPAAALPLFEEAKKLFEAKLGLDHTETLTCMEQLADLYRETGKLALALPLYEETLRRSKTTRGPDHRRTLSCMNGLAWAYQDAQKLELAVPLFEETLTRSKAALGPDHPQTLLTANLLGTAYWSTKQLDKSIPLFEDTMKRRQAVLGHDHLDTVLTTANLGVNYLDADRLKEAMPLLEDAYRIGKNHAQMRWIVGPLQRAYALAGETVKLTNLLSEQLSAARKAVPKDSPQLAGLLAQIGLGLLEQKKWTEAEPLLRESLAIREMKEPDDWRTFNTKSMLGGALLGQKKYADAEPLLLAGYEGMKKQEDKIPPQGKVRLTEAVGRLVQLYEATDNKNEAAKWRQELEARKQAEASPPAEKQP